MRLYFFRRLATRVVRQIAGAQRISVHKPTERELQFADVALAFTAGACSMAVAVLFVLTFLWRPTCF